MAALYFVVFGSGAFLFAALLFPWFSFRWRRLAMDDFAAELAERERMWGM